MSAEKLLSGRLPEWPGELPRKHGIWRQGTDDTAQPVKMLSLSLVA